MTETYELVATVSTVLVPATVGEPVVPYTTPLAMIADPPISVIVPPDVAPVLLVLLSPIVVTDGNVAIDDPPDPPTTLHLPVVLAVES